MTLLSPQLQAFLTITQCKTVHSAAKMLNLTQTAVTQRIRNLEESLNSTLFIRSRRGMQLTEEGQALLRYCQASLELEGETLAKMNTGGKTSSISICVAGPTSIMRSRIIPQCTPILKRFPELLIRFQITDHESLPDLLKTGQTQLAIMPHELVGKEFDSKVLKPERFVLMSPKAWQKRSLQEIIKSEKLVDFDPSDQTSFNYLKKFKLLDHVRRERHFVNSNESLASLIEAELGYGVFTIEFAEKFLKRCNVTILNDGKYLETNLALAWFPRPSEPQYWKALIKSIQ